MISNSGGISNGSSPLPSVPRNAESLLQIMTPWALRGWSLPFANCVSNDKGQRLPLCDIFLDAARGGSTRISSVMLWCQAIYRASEQESHKGSHLFCQTACYSWCWVQHLCCCCWGCCGVFFSFLCEANAGRNTNLITEDWCQNQNHIKTLGQAAATAVWL